MSTLQVEVGGTAYTIQEATLTIKSRVDDKDTATFTLIEPTGTVVFSKGQTVSITDSVQGNLFSGFVNKPTCTNLFPNATNLWSMDCVNQFYVPAKRTHKRLHKGQHAAPIVALQVQEYLEPDGVSGNFGLDWTELQSDWQAGTHSGTSATTNTSTGNVGAGDLEIATGGSQVVVVGDGSGFAIGNGLLLSGYASSGYSTAYTNRQIWSGSQTIATNDSFFYDVWVASSSPAIKAGCDFICSDGTVFSTVNVQDKQFLAPSIATDLSGLANDQWYTRVFFLPSALNGKTLTSVLVGFNSAAEGQYTAYFRRIRYGISGGGFTDFFNDSSTLQTNTQAHNLGYTNVSLTQVQLVDKTGTIAHSGLSISAAGIVQKSQMTWTSALPNGAIGKRETSIDGGATWQALTSGSAIPNLLPGMVATGRSVQYRDTFTAGTDPTSISIGFSGPTLTVNPAYNATKSDLVDSFTTATDFSTGTLTNLVTIGSGSTQGVMLNGVQENWDDGDFSNQPFFGTASPFQQVENKQMILQTGTGTDVRSQLQFAGQWQNFTAEIDVTVPVSTSSTGAGLVYRTTAWQNNNNTFAYSVMLSTTSLQFGRGTNNGSGTGTFTSIATATVSYPQNSVHRIKVVANGSTHQIYVDGVLLITQTDATYTAAGYIGLRFYNATGSTIGNAFDNFGVVASLTGTWQSPSINIAGPATYGNSEIFWDIDGIPDGTCAITAQTSIDGGSTFQSVTNGGAISGLTAGQSLTSKTLILLLTLTANNAPVVPTLNGVTAWVMGQYSSTGTRTNAPLAWDSMTRLPIGSGWGNASNQQTYTQTGTGTTAVSANEATIANTTGDVHMSLLGTGNDMDGTVRFSLSAATISAGMELRYVDANNFYRLSVNTTAISIQQKSGGTLVTFATSAVTLTTNTYYRIRFRIVGSGPINLYGRVWQDGTVEPTTWNVTYTQ